MSWLLDTCVVSELIRPRPKASVVSWVLAHDESNLFLSVITIGELEKGIAKLPSSAKRTTLEHWVRHELADRFRGRLLAIDVGVATHWGRIAGGSEVRGQPLPVIDSLIAATALHHGFSLVTRNEADFKFPELDVINPWQRQVPA